MPKKLTDSEILSILATDLRAGVRYTDSKLSAERRRVEEYYNGKLPAPMHSGNSKYVSTDVFDTVESAKAVMLETFSAHGDIIRFGPRNEDDVAEAQIATAYIKHVIFEQNEGTELFKDIIHGGLTHRNSVAKVYWDHTVTEVEEDFENLDSDTLDDLLADDEVTPIEIAMEDDGTFSGKLTRKHDKSQVRIVALPMEEFIVPPNIKNLRSSPIISHRTEKTKDELKDEGFPADKVNAISDGADNELRDDIERQNRMWEVGGEIAEERLGDRQTETRRHVVYETYSTINIDGTRSKFWKIVHCGDVILDKEQVERHPFFPFCPLPTPHRFWGENFAARVIPTQNAKTVLVRSILDHAVIANNPRYGVVKGALTNPRELLDNRLGGLVNVTRPDGIFNLPQAPLNPFVYQTIQLLDEDKEDVTGVSRLSQGLNKDAISNQNSQGMVEQLISASMQRQKIMSRAFAAQFLGPLFLEAYRLVVENENRQKIIDIAGSWVQVTPSSWASQRDVVIDMRLGYGERDQRAQEYLQLGQLLGSDPVISHLYTAEERYNLYKTVMETKGHRDVAMFLKDPTTTPPPEPDPMVQLEMQAKQQELQLNERKQALAETKVQDRFEIDQLKIDLNRRMQALEFAIKSHEVNLKEKDITAKIAIAADEMELAREAEARSTLTETRDIISPHV